MNWFKKWFTLPPQNNGKPTHAEVAEKTGAILTGQDQTSQQVHDLKNVYAKDLIKLQKQAKIIKRSAERLSNQIDTAVAIAIAAGKLQ